MTVTVCGVFQLPLVNVTLDGLTVPSAVFEPLRPIVTFAVGCDVSTTVNVAVPPASVVVSPLVGVTVMPAASLSVLVTDTSLAEPRVVQVAARRGGGDDRVRDGAVDQGKSSTPVTVTVCGVFQLPLVNATDDGPTVPSAVFELLSPIVTLAVGCDVRTTVNVAAPPASVVVRPDVGVTVIPAASLSVLVTDTSLALRPL